MYEPLASVIEVSIYAPINVNDNIELYVFSCSTNLEYPNLVAK